MSDKLTIGASACPDACCREFCNSGTTCYSRRCPIAQDATGAGAMKHASLPNLSNPEPKLVENAFVGRMSGGLVLILKRSIRVADSRDPVGYRKPPKAHQFQKGQSGCPDGGHAQRAAKKASKEAAKAKADADAEKAREKAMVDIIRRVASEQREVLTKNGRASMSKLEITVRNIADRAMKPDATDRDVGRALALYKHAGLLDPAPEGARSQVLVVYPVMDKDAWAKATEGELLSRNPLEGIPGAENLNLSPKQRRLLPPEDDN